jgi:hypothetical protein
MIPVGKVISIYHQIRPYPGGNAIPVVKHPTANTLGLAIQTGRLLLIHINPRIIFLSEPANWRFQKDPLWAK